MYSPINEDYMFQVMHDRVARMNTSYGKGTATLPNRRWWRRAARVAE